MNGAAVVLLVVSLATALAVIAGVIILRLREERRQRAVAARYVADLQLQRLTQAALAALLDEARQALLRQGRSRP